MTSSAPASTSVGTRDARRARRPGRSSARQPAEIPASARGLICRSADGGVRLRPLVPDAVVEGALQPAEPLLLGRAGVAHALGGVGRLRVPGLAGPRLAERLPFLVRLRPAAPGRS